MRARTPSSSDCIASALNRLGVPPPIKMVLISRRTDQRQIGVQIRQQVIDVFVMRHFALQRVRVEVAVGAFLHAPRNVDVET
jgi:hypothetical protein